MNLPWTQNEAREARVRELLADVDPRTGMPRYLLRIPKCTDDPRGDIDFGLMKLPVSPAASLPATAPAASSLPWLK